MDVSQYLEIFLDESNEHLQTLSDQLIILEKEPDIHVIPLVKDDGSAYPLVNHLAWVKRENEELTIPEQRFVHLLAEKVSE